MYIPLITPTIPPATPGPYKSTGFALLHAPSATRYTLPYPQLEDGSPVMDLTGVTLAIYYPCTNSLVENTNSCTGGHKKRNMSWAPMPTDAVVDGYNAYFDIRGTGWLFYLMKKIIGRFKIPLEPNAPVSEGKYPILILSHGLAGTRTTYSQYCQALASEGYIVLAVEHRDGSGPVYVVPDEDGNRNLHGYAAFKDLVWGKDTKVPDMRLRGVQLDFRVREMYEAYEVAKRIVAGESDAMVEGLTVEAERDFLSQLAKCMDVDNMNIGGHSMGGATVLRVLQTEPPEGYKPLPIQHAVTLDPWLPPFEHADAVPENTEGYPPSLAINSQEYSEWDPHFAHVVDVSKKLGGTLVTVPGMTHESFSDSDVIGGITLRRAQRRLMTCHRLTRALLDGSLEDYVKRWDHDGGAPARNRRGKLVTNDNEVLVHVV